MNAALCPTCSTEESFEQLVLEYQMPLKRMCYMYLHDMALAEDAVQETFLKVYRSLPQFSGGCSARTWIMKIGVNTCRDMLRSAWFRHHDRRIVPEDSIYCMYSTGGKQHGKMGIHVQRRQR